MLATSSGSAVSCEPYCGASTRIQDYGGLGVQGPNVGLDHAKKAELAPGSSVLFDNLFTSTGLLTSLSNLGIGGTGNKPVPRVFKGCTKIYWLLFYPWYIWLSVYTFHPLIVIKKMIFLCT